MKKEFIYVKQGRKHRFLHENESDALTGIRAQLANMFVNSNGEVLTYEKICKDIYLAEPEYFMLRSLDVHISFVKKYIAKFNYIVTRVKGIGFKLEKI